MARAYIPYPSRLAAALLARGEIPYLDAQRMTAEQLNSLYNFHHNIRHAEDGGDHFSNLEPMLIAPHRERTRKIDVPAIAKSKRIAKAHEEFRRRLLAKGQSTPPPSRWPRRKMQKRRP